MAEYIEREAISKLFDSECRGECVVCPHDDRGDCTLMNQIPTADVYPVVRCKDCKHFHLNYFGEVNGVNIIVAHEICDLWAGGCRTTQDTFCSNGVRKDSENNG